MIGHYCAIRTGEPNTSEGHMNIQTIIYDSTPQRLEAIQYILATLSNQGISATMLHPSITSARKLSETLGLEVLSSYDFSYTPVTADCIVVVDGDLLSTKDKRRLAELAKDLIIVVPPGVLVEPPPSAAVHDVLRVTGQCFPEMTGDDELPRTFGCHHVADSCSLCESLVLHWKADRRDG